LLDVSPARPGRRGIDACPRAGDPPPGWCRARQVRAVTCAQTNLQLYGQLLALGHASADVAAGAEAYELAMRLLAGCFRGSGKPFLAHAVGTASVLGSVRARVPVVSAGLLHAAYTLGEFGNGWRGASPAKRAEVRRAVGSEVEELVTRYTELEWS